jgi:antimicrobial peptide system SdpB family protein
MQKLIKLFLDRLNKYQQTGGLSFGINVYRSLLALSTLIVFLFNWDSMKDIYYFGQNPFNLQFFKFDIFSVFGFNMGYTLSIITLITVILGYFPSVSAVLHFYIQASFILHYPNMSDGGDYIITIILFLLIFSFVTDTRMNIWQKPKENWFNENFLKKTVYLNYQAIRIFICVVYFHASVSKFHVTEWYNGTAIYYFLNDPLSGNAALLENSIFKNIVASPFLIAMISWGALLIETLIAFMLFVTNYKTRKRVFYLGCVLHFCIAPLFFIPMFSFRMIIGLYFYLLIKPSEHEVSC